MGVGSLTVLVLLMHPFRQNHAFATESLQPAPGAGHCEHAQSVFKVVLK